MFLLIAVNVVIIPMALLVHPTWTATVDGLVPQFPGGLNSTVLLLVVAIVGTTVAPWQLYFQQSNVVDKRITTRWIPYARADLALGIVIVVVGATALMAVTAFGLAGTADAATSPTRVPWPPVWQPTEAGPSGSCSRSCCWTHR